MFIISFYFPIGAKVKQDSRRLEKLNNQNLVICWLKFGYFEKCKSWFDYFIN